MRRSDVAVFVHLVWGTWDRLPLLVGEVERGVQRALEAKCRQLGADLVAIGGIEDHVHLLVRLPATLAVADLVKHLKGASSHLVTHQMAPDVFFKWQGAYGAFSVSLDDRPAVRHYILTQRAHHNAGTLNADWELPSDDDEQSHGAQTTPHASM